MNQAPSSKTRPPQRGLVCQSCGCRHFHVVYTRRGAGGRLIRRRECRHCGKRITTWEAAIGHWPPTTQQPSL